jgi:5'-methylthioadenosine phosphorylase
MGVKWIISVSACGSLNEKFAPGHLAIPDGLLDRTSGRPLTFFGEGCVAHTSLADPFCPVLSDVLHDACKTTGKTVHMGGNLVVISGPRFSTKTESKLFQSWGMDLINMTTVPEAQLAVEAQIGYGVINCVTDYDCWRESEEPVSVPEVLKTMAGNSAASKEAIKEAVVALKGKESPKWTALQGAVMTKKELVPEATLEKLELIVGDCWPNW